MEPAGFTIACLKRQIDDTRSKLAALEAKKAELAAPSPPCSRTGEHQWGLVYYTCMGDMDTDESTERCEWCGTQRVLVYDFKTKKTSIL